jgi:hypothetical protein
MFLEPFFAGGICQVKVQPDELALVLLTRRQPLFRLFRLDCLRLPFLAEQITAYQAALIRAVR